MTAVCGALYSTARDDAVHMSRRRLDLSLLAEIDREREDGRSDDDEDERSSREDPELGEKGMHIQDEMLSVVAGYYAVKQASKEEGKLQKLEACLSRYCANFAVWEGNPGTSKRV